MRKIRIRKNTKSTSGSRKLSLTKAIKDYSGLSLGLREAKDLADELYDNGILVIDVKNEFAKEFIDEIRSIGDNYLVGETTEFLRNYKVLQIGLGDTNDYAEFISNYITEQADHDETKNIIQLMMNKLGKEELEDIFTKIKINDSYL